MKLLVIFLISFVVTISQAENSSEVQHEWKEFKQEQRKLPENAVYGGFDKEGKKLYIMRKIIDGKVLYGDIFDDPDRKDGFVIDVDEEGEISAADCEVRNLKQN
jgi:cell division protein FtsI/penicillin-binding protein 2